MSKSHMRRLSLREWIIAWLCFLFAVPVFLLSILVVLMFFLGLRF